MDPLPEISYRALQTRDARFDGRLFVGVVSDWNLLPSDLPGTDADTRTLSILFSSAAAQAAGFPRPFTLPPRNCPRTARLARHVEHGLSRAGADC